MPEQSLHRTTERVLDILELVSHHTEGMTFSAVAEEMHIPKSSLHPLLHTLYSRRYLQFNPEKQRYYIGESTFVLGRQYAQSSDILRAIQGEVTKLAQTLDETTFFGVLRETDVLYLAKGEPNTAIRIVTASVGSRNPAYSTGLGKALLLGHSFEQICALYPRHLPPKTIHTLRTRDELWTQLEQMRPGGFAYEKEESTLGIQCISTPVFYNSDIVAAVSVSIPVYRYTPSRKEDIQAALLQAKNRLEGLILLDYEEWSRMDSAPQ